MLLGHGVKFFYIHYFPGFTLALFQCYKPNKNLNDYKWFNVPLLLGICIFSVFSSRSFTVPSFALKFLIHFNFLEADSQDIMNHKLYR